MSSQLWLHIEYLGRTCGQSITFAVSVSSRFDSDCVQILLLRGFVSLIFLPFLDTHLLSGTRMTPFCTHFGFR